MKIFVIMMFMFTLVFTGAESSAQRVGGGKSLGKQSTNVLKRQSTPPVKNTTPSKPATAQSSTSQPATSPAPAVTPAGSSIGPMLGGLAAGLGLAWLANSLGLGEAFGNILMILLMAGVALLVVGWFISRRNRKDTDSNISLNRYQDYK
jgi:predicted lipid-binding transport protein (Tim44 family)